MGSTDQERGSAAAAYTVEQAARVAGLSMGQMRHTFMRILPPKFSQSGMYAFRDLVALRTLATLRNERGVRVRDLRDLAAWFRDKYDQPWSSLRFFTDGREVIFREPETTKLMSGWKPGQYTSAEEFPIEPVLIETKNRAIALVQRTPDQHGKFSKQKGYVSNKKCIAGTRIPVETIHRFHDAGYSVDAIIDEYPSLTARDVEAAIKEAC